MSGIHELSVCSGARPRIGANGVKVPTYLYKLVYDATTNKAWAHWQENRGGGETVGRPISYQELVKRTGAEFCRALQRRTKRHIVAKSPLTNTAYQATRMKVWMYISTPTAGCSIPGCPGCG